VPGFATPSAAAVDNIDLVQALRAGGLVIVVRHGATFPDQADTDPLNFDNIAAQRNLNDKGKSLAKAFGDAIRQVGVPVGRVFTSKYNRAYETAVIAGFRDMTGCGGGERGAMTSASCMREVPTRTLGRHHELVVRTRDD
jgi:hypothetical protein